MASHYAWKIKASNHKFQSLSKEKKGKYDAGARVKQLRIGKGKGIGKHSKDIRYLGVSGKGKGEKPQSKITKPRVTSLITKVAPESDQLLVSITGIC